MALVNGSHIPAMLDRDNGTHFYQAPEKSFNQPPPLADFIPDNNLLMDGNSYDQSQWNNTNLVLENSAWDTNLYGTQNSSFPQWNSLQYNGFNGAPVMLPPENYYDHSFMSSCSTADAHGFNGAPVRLPENSFNYSVNSAIVGVDGSMADVGDNHVTQFYPLTQCTYNSLQDNGYINGAPVTLPENSLNYSLNGDLGDNHAPQYSSLQDNVFNGAPENSFNHSPMISGILPPNGSTSSSCYSPWPHWTTDNMPAPMIMPENLFNQSVIHIQTANVGDNNQTAVPSLSSSWPQWTTHQDNYMLDRAPMIFPVNSYNQSVSSANLIPGTSTTAVDVRDNNQTAVHSFSASWPQWTTHPNNMFDPNPGTSPEVLSDQPLRTDGRVDDADLHPLARESPELQVSSGEHGRIRAGRKKPMPWTILEHRQFLEGLRLYGKGDWRKISRHMVKTRTSSQVASHAQKYFNRKELAKEKRKRPSIHDITSVDEIDAAAQLPADQTPQQQHPINHVVPPIQPPSEFISTHSSFV